MAVIAANVTYLHRVKKILTQVKRNVSVGSASLETDLTVKVTMAVFTTILCDSPIQPLIDVLAINIMVCMSIIIFVSRARVLSHQCH